MTNKAKESRLAEKADGKRESILDAAASVFMELGFSDTSIDDVSDALGATKGIVYYYFKSKSVLFFAVQQRAMELTREILEPLANSNGGPEERLEAMAIAHTLLIMRHLPYLRVAGQGLLLHLSGRTTVQERKEIDRINALRDSNEELYLKVLQDGVEAGVFRQFDARLLVKPLLGSLNWTSRWYRPRPDEKEADRQQMASEIALFAVNAVLSRSPSKKLRVVS